MPKSSPLKDKQLLKEAIDNCSSRVEILKYLGLRSAGGNFGTLNKYASKYGYKLPDPVKNIKTAQISKLIDNELVFVENSTYNNGQLIKRRLYSLGVEEKCSMCGVGNIWNGKPLTLQLDHINGIHTDNRLENLAIVCSNCHTQTSTYAGRNLPKAVSVDIINE